ncbi:MAG: type II toxin-antitoxin system RelE/ParE family toxin [Calditrichaeota bacterium]|nr:type II toxin-antitoxin system RelE/ParE family toxin [Calditrichota bacterium]
MRIELSPKALRQLKKLSRDVKLMRKIADALDGIAECPYDGKALDGQFAGTYSYRVGNWRILYEIYKGQLLIIVISIGDRKEVYRSN